MGAPLLTTLGLYKPGADEIRDIAANLEPERLGVSAEADRGAPIVGGDSMVESGNGRVLAIRRAYEQGGEPADRYPRESWTGRA